jgi:hypothetical protein
MSQYGPFNPAKLFLLKVQLHYPPSSASSLLSRFLLPVLVLILPHSRACAAVIPRNIRTIAAAAPAGVDSRGGAADTQHADGDVAFLRP